MNHILKHPILKAMTREFLSDDEFINEFSHTVLHNKNVFAMTTQILEESRKNKKEEKIEKVEKLENGKF